MNTLIYSFGNDAAEGPAAGVSLLGGKGAALAEMARHRLPVPPGFTLTTEVSRFHQTQKGAYPQGLDEMVKAALDRLALRTGRRFGDPHRPLFLAVRSGAPLSMPGMMDSILNVGLNAATVETLAMETGNPTFAFGSYHRLIAMMGAALCDLDPADFEDILDRHKIHCGSMREGSLTHADWRALIAASLKLYAEGVGAPFPDDPQAQLWQAIDAVFSSFMSKRARSFRELHGLSDTVGTAVTVQAMVFGNKGPRSATGVFFTRHPLTGEKELYGEFLPRAQGEAVVGGGITPDPLTEKQRRAQGGTRPSLEALMPDLYALLEENAARVERIFGDMQDVEFTIEEGTLWLLQARAGKRGAEAALRIALDLIAEGVLSRDEAIARLDPNILESLRAPVIDPDASCDVIAMGLPASPGAVTGEIVFTPDEAEKARAEGRAVILVREETRPEDIRGMHASAGILTLRGGATSHAAAVARALQKPCVCGAGTLLIERDAEVLHAGERRFPKGALITIDGNTGRVIAGPARIRERELSGALATLKLWREEAQPPPEKG